MPSYRSLTVHLRTDRPICHQPRGQLSSTVDVEDGGTAILDLTSGAIATLIGGYWIPRWSGEVHWTIRGSKRWVHWNPNKPDTSGSLEIHGPQPQWYAAEETYDAPIDSAQVTEAAPVSHY